MTVAALEQRDKPARWGLPLVLGLAMREQRNGLKGFYVFIACVALGVAAITGVGALADALRASFERQGEALLGGDVTLSRPHKAAEGGERAWLTRQGRAQRDRYAEGHGSASRWVRAGAGRSQGCRRCLPVGRHGASSQVRCRSMRLSARDRARWSIRSCSNGSG